jgi:hypothetical protein
MTDNMPVAHTLLIWDNGSYKTPWDWRANMFVRSTNIGKTSALACIARMLPADVILCYSDDDMLFAPDWYEQQRMLLDCFPNVAAVSGCANRQSFGWGNERTLAWARECAEVKMGRFIPEEQERDYAESIGRDYEWLRFDTRNMSDELITYNGLSAYATAAHCQFMGYAGTIAQACAYSGRAMEDERDFDIRLDKLGLRLSTMERTSRHMGNLLDGSLLAEIARVRQ